MLIVLFLAIYVALLLNKKEKPYFVSVILYTTVVYFCSELLSLFNRLEYRDLVFSYGIILLILGSLIGIFVYRNYRNKKQIKLQLKNLLKNHRREALFWILVFIGFGIVFLSINTVPYNWDSMTYHLPRLTQWMQNKSVAHYATGDIRQVTSPVLAELMNLQVYIFTGGQDQYLNLLQTCSYLTNASLIYFIAEKLKAKKQYCYLVSLMFMSMPIAFGEALTTQVDHFSTLWLLLFVYYLLDLLQTEVQLAWNKDILWKVVLLSFCIGFGYLAKPSVLIGMFLFSLWLLYTVIRRKDSFVEVAKLILVAVGIIIVIVLPEIGRNLVTFGAVSAPVAGARQMIGTLHPLYVFVNGLKNLGMNLPNTYFSWGGMVEYGIYWISYLLGVEINDTAIAEDGRVFFLHQAGEYGHDIAINPLIIIVMFCMILWLFHTILKKAKLEISGQYVVLSIISFLIFCCILRWEPFVTRYMLSYLALLCPAAAVWLTKIRKGSTSSSIYGIILFLCIVELLQLSEYHTNIMAEQKQWENTMAGYFSTRSQERDNYLVLKEILEEESFRSLGLLLSVDTYEYPIWKMVKDGTVVQNVCVENETSRYKDHGFLPEAIVIIKRDPENLSSFGEGTYLKYREVNDEISVWKLRKD